MMTIHLRVGCYQAEVPGVVWGGGGWGVGGGRVWGREGLRGMPVCGVQQSSQLQWVKIIEIT